MRQIGLPIAFDEDGKGSVLLNHSHGLVSEEV